MEKRYGLIKTTLLDYPGLVAAVVFTAGCNLRCPWCHNPALVRPPWDEGLLTEAQILDTLARRRSVLQGVVVTGGEPLFLPDLSLLLEKLKELGFRLKLDTNGTWPDRLLALRPGLVDYLAVDLKAAPSRYAVSAGIPVATEKVSRTLDWIRQRPGAGEVRLTWVPDLNDEGELKEYAAFVGSGLPVWVQGYRPGLVLDPAVASTRATTREELDRVTSRLVELGVDAKVRA